MAGIAAELWRELLNAGNSGEITGDIERMLADVVAIALQSVAKGGQVTTTAQLQTAKAGITQRMLAQTLKQLDITPDPRAMQQIEKRLFGYIPALSADVKARSEGDFESEELKSKAPGLPKRQVTWEQLLDQYVM